MSTVQKAPRITEFLTLRIAHRGINAYHTASQHQPQITLRRELSFRGLTGDAARTGRRRVVGAVFLAGRVCINVIWRRY